MVHGRGVLSPLWIAPANTLGGSLRPPGDKSISHRYLMLSGVARGTTEISNLAPGADAAATIACMRALGVEVASTGDFGLRVSGLGWDGLRTPPVVIDAQNSGTTLRLVAGLLAGRPITVTLTGDESLRRRPMARIVEPLTAMGARISATNGNAPLSIDGGGLHGIEWRPPVASAQVKSAIMLAALSATGESVVIEPHATRDHSERAFPAFGLECSVSDRTIRVRGGQEAAAPPSGHLSVPGDPSSAAVWAAAAAGVPDSHVTMDGVCLNPRRLGFIEALRRMGAEVRTEVDHLAGGEPVGSVFVRHLGHGSCEITADQVPDLID